MALTYGKYLKVDELLSLQKPLSEPVEHDEELFIIIHQVYELWFKLILHEFDKVKSDFSENRLWDAIHTLKRIRMVLKTLVQQIDILETMTPISFNSFRSRLDTASGFQSVQFRELEFLLGHKRQRMIDYHKDSPSDMERLRRRYEEPSLHWHLYDFLEANGVKIPDILRNKPHTDPIEPNNELQSELIRIYREKPEMTILLELLTDIDEGLQEWRYRHVKMVERTTGFKKGTGGSDGVTYLRKTLFNPVFPDLWAIRDNL